MLEQNTRSRHEPLHELFAMPWPGAPLEVRSSDGTRIHCEVLEPVGARDDRPGAAHGDVRVDEPGDARASAQPTVVLVPGWTETLQVFGLITRSLLAHRVRVVAFDLRGQGASGLPCGGDQRIERYGEDLEAVLQVLGAPRERVVVAGHSLGGMAIMAWAGAFDPSRRVAGAALLNTGASGLLLATRLLPKHVPARIRHALGVRALRHGTPGLGRVSSAAALRRAHERPAGHRAQPVSANVLAPSTPARTRRSTPLSRAITRFAAFGPGASAAQVEFMERMTWSCPRPVRDGAGATLAELDVLSGAKHLNVPTLVLSGACDRLTPPALAEQITAAVPLLSESVLIDGAGHMAVLERPAEVAEALLRLARDTGALI